MVSYRVVKPLFWEEGELWVRIDGEPKRAVDCSLQELAPIHHRYRASEMESEMEALGEIIQDKLAPGWVLASRELDPLEPDLEFVLAMTDDLPAEIAWEKRVAEAIRRDDEAAAELRASSKALYSGEEGA